MILVEDCAEIRRLHRAEQMPIRAIARHLGILKNTVKRALANDRPPQYRRPAIGCLLVSCHGFAGLVLEGVFLGSLTFPRGPIPGP